MPDIWASIDAGTVTDWLKVTMAANELEIENKYKQINMKNLLNIFIGLLFYRTLLLTNAITASLFTIIIANKIKS